MTIYTTIQVTSMLYINSIVHVEGVHVWPVYEKSYMRYKQTPSHLCIHANNNSNVTLQIVLHYL